jgi:catechol 2,3-dioxygenase-like lactoylglutathione lyase family enzyme
MKLKYVIKFVADMDRTVKFYRDVLLASLLLTIPPPCVGSVFSTTS